MTALILFAISNMQDVEVTYSPVHVPFEVPLSVLILATLALGCVMGGFLIWFQYGPLSRRAFKHRHEVKDLKRELKEEQSSHEPERRTLFSIHG